jgi:uncharacterized PurR-regulated membrane protein YhhQ (DUF165 family)
VIVRTGAVSGFPDMRNWRRLQVVSDVHEVAFIMSNIFAARSQMGISLAFHITLAVIDVALPFMMGDCGKRGDRLIRIFQHLREE